MKYLCCRHQALIEHNEHAAMDLWHKAMAHAVKSYDKHEWPLVRSFSGSAFEVALIRLDTERGWVGMRNFMVEHLCDAARMLVSSLSQVEQLDEAEEVLNCVQASLLKHVARKNNTYDEAKHIMHLIEEFSKRTSALLRVRGKCQHADAVSLACHQTLTSVRRECLH